LPTITNPCFYFFQGCNKTIRASEDVSCGFKFKARKRVYAADAPTRCTKSRKNTEQPDASLPTSGIPVPPPPPTLQSVVNSAVLTQPAAEGEFWYQIFCCQYITFD
jgi:hypothetical protein